MNTAALITALCQLTMGAGAWRLANALKVKVQKHDGRLDDHERRIVKLEAR